MKKIDYTIVVGLIMAVIGWGVSVESRLATQAESLNLSNRIRAMEELMLPMLLDWKTHKELKKWQQENIDKIKGQVDKSDSKKKTTTVFKDDDEDVPASVQRSVDKWAKDVLGKQVERPDRLTPVAEPNPSGKP